MDSDGGALPYDPWSTCSIGVAELEACARMQGVTFRQADILLIRIGFIQKYCAVNNDARVALGDDAEHLCVISFILLVPPLVVSADFLSVVLALVSSRVRI